MSRQIVLLAALVTAIVLLGCWGMTLGVAPLSPLQVFDALIGQGDPRAVIVVQEIRLPRALLAAAVGGALALSGAALQGLLRNPLAEPGVIGTSASAALGAVIALYYGWAAVFPLALPLSGMAGAALGTLLLLLLAGPGAGSLTLLLSGVAISALASSMTALAMNLSPTPYALNEIVLWLMGSLKDRSLEDVALAVPFIALGGGLILSAGSGLDALSLGEEAAGSLGVDILVLRLKVVVGSALAVGAAVAAVGAVGFVGLVVPHLLRRLVRHRPSALLLPAFLGGGALVLAADIVARLIPSRAEMMLGVVTAMAGGPFFLFLIARLRGEKL